MDNRTKAATAARMYDYYLGGRNNFPADREAADRMIALFPQIPASARSNRAFLRRAVRYMAGHGIRQFLDLGSGIPTEGNVHEIAQDIAPDTRVVYVDIDPVAVAESLDILDGNQYATAICADFRDVDAVLGHPRLKERLDFDRPIAVILASTLQFVPDDTQARAVVDRLVATIGPGSHLVISHIAVEGFRAPEAEIEAGHDVYRKNTATPTALRSHADVRALFTGTDLVEPGLVWMSLWRPDPEDPDPMTDDPLGSGMWAGVGRRS